MNSKGADDDDAPLRVSQNPRFGVVRKVVLDLPYAAQFDDLNSDFREVSLTIFKREGSRWAELLSSDDAGYPARDNAAQYGWSDDFAWAVGFDPPGVQVRVMLLDEVYPVPSDAEGWWLFVRPASPPPKMRRGWSDGYLRLVKG